MIPVELVVHLVKPTRGIWHGLVLSSKFPIFITTLWNNTFAVLPVSTNIHLTVQSPILKRLLMGSHHLRLRLV